MAITYGEPDAGEHPYVGLMIYFDPSEPGWFSCSGTLLDEDTFLTAGHCTYGVGTGGEVILDPDGEPITTGGTDVWATFGEEDVLAGWPARTPDISEEDLYEARSAWLDANPDFYNGEAIPHPDYDNFAEFPTTYDVGVVEPRRSRPRRHDLHGASRGRPRLLRRTGADRHRRDARRSSPEPQCRLLVESVGYGTQSVQPHPMDETFAVQIDVAHR